MKAIIAGIYFLFDGKEIVYVGQSSDIFRRIYEHSSGRSKGAKKKFDTWEYFEIADDAERLRAEDLLILALKPKYNIDYSGANARSATANESLQNDNGRKVSKIQHFVDKFEQFSRSISSSDMDVLFEMPRGTFDKLIRERKISEDDYYSSFMWPFCCRIKYDAAYEMAQNFLKNKLASE
jgi:hypothetical protein